MDYYMALLLIVIYLITIVAMVFNHKLHKDRVKNIIERLESERNKERVLTRQFVSIITNAAAKGHLSPEEIKDIIRQTFDPGVMPRQDEIHTVVVQPSQGS